MSASSLSLRSVGHTFGSVVALEDVSLHGCGGVISLLGPNGAGKTTLMRGVATVHRFTTGSVHIDGLDPTQPAQRTEIRRRLGYLPQELGCNPRASVFDVVDYVAVLKGLRADRARHHEVHRVLDVVELRDRATQRVGELSGGMRRRLGLAQALIGGPSLLVLDEPAAGLDPEQRLKLRAQLSELSRDTTVVVSTHLTDEAAAMSETIHVIDAGRIVFSGTPMALAARANGLVFHLDAPPASSGTVSWRLPDGRWRCLGHPPPGATVAAPTAEDGYLLLVGHHRDARRAGGDPRG